MVFGFRKNKCFFCYKLFIPEFCKCCEYKDYGLCEQCHKYTEHHKVSIRRAINKNA